MAFTEASSPGPSRAWRGGFIVFLFGALCYTICTFKLAKVVGNIPCNTWEWPGTYKLYCSRSLPAVLYFLCTMKAPPQALEGPGEEPLWHLS